jgi:hypothetical protein
VHERTSSTNLERGPANPLSDAELEAISVDCLGTASTPTRRRIVLARAPFRLRGRWSPISSSSSPEASQWRSAAFSISSCAAAPRAALFLRRGDLPQDRGKLARVVAAVVGSGPKLNKDGIGGGNAVTTKLAMQSQEAVANIDYFFAQIFGADRLADFQPTCGNMLAGVGSAPPEARPTTTATR